ncbi:hypothetical protein [Psychrobacillus glaciei]|uniref:hypothetical protein n=1 Tax=Psychrobacillus glaciei TaxID=2283160 RepID=UPI00178C1CD4|nr:hypothetical protein [Psychrobacillus glaciei]
MKIVIHIMVIIVLLLLTVFLYNKQLGSIPLLFISFYLFLLATSKNSFFKKNK